MRLFIGSIVLVASIIGVLLYAENVSAHVLIKSDDGSRAAILHVIPDDDPIAGEKAMLIFDTQKGVLDQNSQVTLRINNTNTNLDADVLTKVEGSLVTSTYTFPVQGVYEIKYEVKSPQGQYDFTQTMRISRGIKGSDSTSVNYSWAEALLFGVSALALGMGIVAWNHRKEIFKSSTL